MSDFHRSIIEKFKTEGYCVLENIIDSDMLNELSRECEHLLSTTFESDSQLLVKSGCIVHPSTMCSGQWLRSEAQQRCYIDIVRKLLLPNNHDHASSSQLYLVNEQFIVKPPAACRGTTAFDYHRDAQYLPNNVADDGDDDSAVKNYISLWTALCDCDEENGTLYVLPLNRWNDRTTPPPQQLTNDFERAIIVDAGSVVVLSSQVWHRSSDNLSMEISRRAFMPQFSFNARITDDDVRLMIDTSAT